MALALALAKWCFCGVTVFVSGLAIGISPPPMITIGLLFDSDLTGGGLRALSCMLANLVILHPGLLLLPLSFTASSSITSCFAFSILKGVFGFLLHNRDLEIVDDLCHNSHLFGRGDEMGMYTVFTGIFQYTDESPELKLSSHL